MNGWSRRRTAKPFCFSLLSHFYCKYYSQGIVLAECYYTFNYKDHCDPGLFYMLHIILISHRMVLYISTGYRVLSIVYLDQLKGAHHKHISYISMPNTHFFTFKQGCQSYVTRCYGLPRFFSEGGGGEGGGVWGGR